MRKKGKKRPIRGLIIIIIGVLLLGGGVFAVQQYAYTQETGSEDPKVSVPETEGNTKEKSDNSIASKAGEAVAALKNKDMKKLSALVHPVKGVRLSPYAFVDMKNDRVLTASQVENALNDSAKYTWGSFDGSGEPIEMTFAEYLDRFIYDKDYAGTDRIGYNQFFGKGNTKNNAFEVYTNAGIVEYHIPGVDPQFGGVDWGSLRLVFEESGGTWYLVGIIHDMWTI